MLEILVFAQRRILDRHNTHNIDPGIRKLILQRAHLLLVGFNKRFCFSAEIEQVVHPKGKEHLVRIQPDDSGEKLPSIRNAHPALIDDIALGKELVGGDGLRQGVADKNGLFEDSFNLLFRKLFNLFLLLFFLSFFFLLLLFLFLLLLQHGVNLRFRL